jgi:hypothetical protein
MEFFAGLRILRGTGESYVTFPHRLLAEHFPDAVGGSTSWDPAHPMGRPLPKDLGVQCASRSRRYCP